VLLVEGVAAIGVRGRRIFVDSPLSSSSELVSAEKYN